MRSESPGQAEPQRVAVWANDLTLARDIGRAVVLAGHEVVGTGHDLAELIDDRSGPGVDLVVVAVHPARDAAALGLLRRRRPDLAVIAVVTALRDADSARLLAADIDGIVLASEIERVLGPAIASLDAGQLCVPSGALAALAGPVFSHREKQVLRLVVAGLTNSEIAGQLYLSESTIKSHLSSSFRKLGVSSRAEVVRRARGQDGALRLSATLDQTVNSPVPALV